MRSVASEYKIAWHSDKLKAFLAGERVLPVTVEMDITTECNKTCDHCPSGLGLMKHNLDLAKVERFFAETANGPRGLLLSGGEPTMSPDFADTLALARKYGFVNLAIVSNGSQLGKDGVAGALLENATSVRISIYDWDNSGNGQMCRILRSVSNLRERIEQEKSGLEVGFSFLTSADVVDQLPSIAAALRDSGAHWLYVHPRCKGWEESRLSQFEQDGVARMVESLQAEYSDFEILMLPTRYTEKEIEFDEYYTAHFLMVVGADGNIYVGTETKYNPDYVIGRISEDWTVEDLWSERRVEKLRGLNSGNYFPVGGRHRGSLYSHLVQRMLNGDTSVDSATETARVLDIQHPYIL